MLLHMAIFDMAPSKVFPIYEEAWFFIHKIEKQVFAFQSSAKNVDFGCLVDFVVAKSLTKTWAINAAFYKKI